MEIVSGSNLIGGEWVGSGSHAVFETRNPARPDEVLATFPAATRDDARRAVAAAAESLPAWRATPAPARGAILFKAAALLDERFDDIAATLTREEGKTLAESRARSGGRATSCATTPARGGGSAATCCLPTRRGDAADAARADRRRRRDHALELPHRDPGLEARPGARLRQQRRLQAGVRHAADGAAAGRVSCQTPACPPVS